MYLSFTKLNYVKNEKTFVYLLVSGNPAIDRATTNEQLKNKKR